MKETPTANFYRVTLRASRTRDFVMEFSVTLRDENAAEAIARALLHTEITRAGMRDPDGDDWRFQEVVKLDETEAP